MKVTYLLLGLTIGVNFLFAQTKSQPNIIVFMVDDMGWQDTSVPFAGYVTEQNKKYHTPNMERLAAQGMKFTNAYSNSVCTPTRVSLLTGMNAAKHRVTNWTSPRKNKPTDYPDDLFLSPEWNCNGLSAISGTERTVYATTFPQLLNDAGYFTIHVGKAHWGSVGTSGSNPRNLGFSVNVAGSAIGSPESYYGLQNYGNIVGEKLSVNAVPGLESYYGSETFLTQALTEEAIKAISEPIKHGRPFFLYLSHYAVHTPIQGDPRFLAKYLEQGMDTVEANYASLIEGMDKSLGDIMDLLEAKNVSENTLILFMSDNGGLSLVPPRGGQKYTHNLPLRAGKGSLYEGGIREPMIVKWPDEVKPGTVSFQYVSIMDFFPTVLEAAGIKDAKTVQAIDGLSLIPYLKDPAKMDSSRIMIWHYPNRWTKDETNAFCYASAIRQGEWKLVYLMKQGKLELYNLKSDLEEQHDLSKSHPLKVAELASKLTWRLKTYDAQMPTYKRNGQQVAWPNEIVRDGRL